MQAADGSIYEVVPRLAFVAADFQQIQQNVALVGRGCHVCECPYEELDRTGMQWPLRDLRNIMESLYSLADEVLDENGLANPLFWESSPGHAALMSDVKAVAIWNRLSKRLSSIEEDEAGFTISSKMAKHFLKV